MSVLDNQIKIKKIDQSKMLDSIKELPLQCRQAWYEAKKVKIPASYHNVKKIVVSGMGGSGLGGHVIQFLFWDRIKLPMQVINSYTIPACVDKDTLFLVSSYSGNTEETIDTIAPAKVKNAKIIAITKGGKIGKLVLNGKTPGYLIKEDHNLCGQPRMGIGYSVFGQLALLSRCGIIDIKDKDVEQVVNVLKKLNKKFAPNISTGKNPAKQIALKLHERVPVLVAADFLTGSVHVFSNQLNENAKTFACYFPISEMNHHLMEGLSQPKKYKKSLRFLFIQSKLYHPRNQKRIEVSKDVVESNSIDFIEHQLQSKTKFEQAFELLIFGSYVSFYLAVLNGIDPSPVPWVDYFKEQLEK
ncbi:MAG: SIS domain-containing protein [Patescibacteria group bacterium]|jgi:glucose/mannose-6-phosphate isomerase